jgi:hypothetical protein
MQKDIEDQVFKLVTLSPLTRTEILQVLFAVQIRVKAIPMATFTPVTD